MNIDTLNAYCGPVLVAGPPLCQGRSNHPSSLAVKRSACIVWSEVPCRLPARLRCEPDLLSVYPTLGSLCSGLVASAAGVSSELARLTTPVRVGNLTVLVPLLYVQLHLST